MTAHKRTLLLAMVALLCGLAVRPDGSAAPPGTARDSSGRAAAARFEAVRSVDGLTLIETSRRADAPRVSLPAQQASVAALVGADRWRAAGFTGYGVRVAIVDQGFAGYEALLGNGLPAGTRARSFRADRNIEAGSSHGTFAARVVAGMAPQAQLYLLNFSTQAELAALTTFLAQEQIQVVSYSLSSVFTGPGNGTGVVNDLVGRSAAGLFWAVSAGNWAAQHWGGTFTDRSGNTVHEFAPGLEENGRLYRAQDLITVALRWDNVWGAACDDYDLELFGPDGALVRAARELQECDDDPVERIEVLATRDGRYRARVIRVPGSAARRFDLVMLGTPDRGDALDLSMAAGSLLEPADHPSVFTVGAASSLNFAQPSRFSSRGPTLDGRIKPDVIAPAGPQPFGDGEFAGTSAATPYVAGAAALPLEAFPGLSPRALATQLRERALYLPPAGPDSDAGVGLLQMGTLSGLGPLLPAGASAATFTDFTPANAPLAVFRYRGPSGFPARFAYTLTGARTPVAFYRLDIARARFDLFAMRAPTFVNTFDVFNDGDFIFVRFQ